MKQTIGFSDFCDAFTNHDRAEQFSYEGKKVIFEYLEQYEEGTGEELELDVIAICCDFNEDSADYIASNYMDSEEYGEFKELSEDEQIDGIREYLNDNTMLLGETSSGFVYQAF